MLGPSGTKVTLGIETRRGASRFPVRGRAPPHCCSPATLRFYGNQPASRIWITPTLLFPSCLPPRDLSITTRSFDFLVLSPAGRDLTGGAKSCGLHLPRPTASTANCRWARGPSIYFRWYQAGVSTDSFWIEHNDRNTEPDTKTTTADKRPRKETPQAPPSCHLPIS